MKGGCARNALLIADPAASYKAGQSDGGMGGGSESPAKKSSEPAQGRLGGGMGGGMGGMGGGPDCSAAGYRLPTFRESAQQSASILKRGGLKLYNPSPTYKKEVNEKLRDVLNKIHPKPHG